MVAIANTAGWLFEVLKPLLNSKFYIPPLRLNMVARPRLVEKLLAGLDTRLTVISAPAGFGKTTLLVDWILQSARPTAWVSLDKGDNDPVRFMRYFVAALQKIVPEFGVELVALLQSGQPALDECFRFDLINAMAEFENPFALVLDDYHVITAPAVQELMLFILDNLPPQIHLVIATRADPPWPLARRRSRGEICEIRTQEMRFTADETAAFLNEIMQFELGSEDVAALETRTEGWVAGLQMAALSMRTHRDRSAFIRSFTGSHRFVMDYLIEEVLSQQPMKVQTFLLQTSLLDRFNAELCDFVLGETDSRQVLAALDQANLFLVPLDERCHWYRYHHLFSDLLRQRLQQSYPDQMPALHRRASTWYRTNGSLSDALQHAMAGMDLARVAELTEEMVVHRLDAGELNALLLWLERLPGEAIRNYPWLLVARGWALLHVGDYEALENSLSEVDVHLGSVVRADAALARLRGHLAAIRSHLAELREDVPSAIRQAEQALQLLPETEYHLRAFVAIHWANCLVWFGEHERAIPAYREAGEASKLAGDDQLALTAFSEMALVQMNTGRLRQAVETIREARDYGLSISRRDGRRLPAMGTLYRHLASILRELNELPAAREAADQAVILCEQWGEKEAGLFSYLVSARVWFACGKMEQADLCLQRTEQLAQQISPWSLRFVRSWRVYFDLLSGKLLEAEAWAAELSLSRDDDFGYESHFEYQNLARLLSARGDYTGAMLIVEKLLKVCESARALIYRVKYGIFQARLLNSLGRRQEMLTGLEKSLSLARQEGYVRSILDEGPEVAVLLTAALTAGIEVNYVRQLLQILGEEADPTQVSEPFEPLTERELEVLRLLVTELNTLEIAEALVLSVNTVRSHIKNIYGKLGVHSRFEAVHRAQVLDIL